jgi:hypothetical protein
MFFWVITRVVRGKPDISEHVASMSTFKQYVEREAGGWMQVGELYYGSITQNPASSHSCANLNSNINQSVSVVVNMEQREDGTSKCLL